MTDRGPSHAPRPSSSAIDWLASLQSQVTTACTRTASAFAGVRDVRQRVAVRLERVAERIGTADERREQSMSGERHKRIVNAVREREISSLPARDRRYAAKQIDELDLSDLRALLAATPACWNAFAAACFRRWEVFIRLPARAELRELLATAPKNVRFLHATGSPHELLRDGPIELARRIRTARGASVPRDLVTARDLLVHLGFLPSWTFTQQALARWARGALGRGAFTALWQAVQGDGALEAMLLPASSDGNRSWFSSERRPGNVASAVAARADFVTALIATGLDDGAPPAQWQLFLEKLLASDFGDPRVPPESEGWRAARSIDAKSCQRLLEGLITEDLTVFFDHAMQDPRRKRFWLRYVRLLRRTTCILDRGTYLSLGKKLASSDEKLAAAVARARQFTTRDGVQAFCLTFDSFVVVEFSDTGHAAYLYSREFFERTFQATIDAESLSGPSMLKITRPTRLQEPHCLGTIIHHTSWETKAEQQLAALGAVPGR